MLFFNKHKNLTDTSIQQNIQNEADQIVQNFEKRPFWIAERVLFLVSVVIFAISTLLLIIFESGNTSPLVSNYNQLEDFLFNSVSVGTLTGLFRGDAGSYSFFGQFVLFLNMLLSGIVASIVSILLLFFIRFGVDKKQSLKKELKRLGVDSWSTIRFVIVDLLGIIVIGTMLLLFYGHEYLWEAVFNSTSHFVNAGITAQPGGMQRYAQNNNVLLIGSILITLGGLGVSIRAYFYYHICKLMKWKKILNYIPKSVLAPKRFVIIVIGLSLALQFIGAISIYYFEHNNPLTLGGNTGSDFLNSLYLSISSRTAGFSTLPNLALTTDKTQFLLMIFMVIGGAPGSFAGGILKLTAASYFVSLLFGYFYNLLKGKTSRLFRYSKKTKMEINIRVLGLTVLTLVAVSVLFFSEAKLSGHVILFEIISAISNTGLSLGATSQLSTSSLVIIMILMTVGKIGFVSFLISFLPKVQKTLDTYEHSHDSMLVD